jgi:hypothetical protein
VVPHRLGAALQDQQRQDHYQQNGGLSCSLGDEFNTTRHGASGPHFHISYYCLKLFMSSSLTINCECSNVWRLLFAHSDRRFKFDKSRQLFIRAHNETLSVDARSKAFFWVRPLARVPKSAVSVRP